MSTILSNTVVEAAQAEADKYAEKAQGLYDKLAKVISDLSASGFIGDASTGYNTFFTTKITPVITTNLYGSDASLMGAIKKMMGQIGDELMRNVDPALQKANEEAGSASAEDQ